MPNVRVGVLRGGVGVEYDVSLKTGQSVLEHLPEHYLAKDILLSKDGTWHLGGLPTTPSRLPHQVDVIFNALHGEYGEDGQVQALLDSHGLPYTGSGAAASAFGMNKQTAKEIFRRAGIKTPEWLTVSRNENLGEATKKVFWKIAPPWVIKPLNRGSSVGVSWALTLDQLAEAVTRALEESEQALVEKYIAGKEATCGVVDNFRGEEHYVLPPIEIRKPNDQHVWDYEYKYNGETEEICPGLFSPEEKRAIEAAARQIHRALGLRHYSRSDFIVSPRGIFALEVNTLPGLTSESLLPKALQAVGCSYPQFLDHLISLALKK